MPCSWNLPIELLGCTFVFLVWNCPEGFCRSRGLPLGQSVPKSRRGQVGSAQSLARDGLRRQAKRHRWQRPRQQRHFPLDLPEAVDFFDNAVTRTLAGISFGHRHDLTSHVRFGEVSAAHRARAAAVLKKFDVLATLENISVNAFEPWGWSGGSDASKIDTVPHSNSGDKLRQRAHAFNATAPDPLYAPLSMGAAACVASINEHYRALHTLAMGAARDSLSQHGIPLALAASLDASVPGRVPFYVDLAPSVPKRDPRRSSRTEGSS
jgi:hypothetical protein